MNIAIVCTGLLGLLLFGLGLYVSLMRQSTRVIIGCPDNPAARLVMHETAAHSRPASCPAPISRAVDMPTASAPHALSARISAGVS